MGTGLGCNQAGVGFSACAKRETKEGGVGCTLIGTAAPAPTSNGRHTAQEVHHLASCGAPSWSACTGYQFGAYPGGRCCAVTSTKLVGVCPQSFVKGEASETMLHGEYTGSPHLMPSCIQDLGWSAIQAHTKIITHVGSFAHHCLLISRPMNVFVKANQLCEPLMLFQEPCVPPPQQCPRLARPAPLQRAAHGPAQRR